MDTRVKPAYDDRDQFTRRGIARKIGS